MVNKTISLSQEIFDKLRGEDNASALIDTLLINHYNLVQSPKEKWEELKKEIELKSQQAESLQNKVEAMEKKKDEMINIELEKESMKEESEETWERRKKLQYEVFKLWDIKKDEFDLLFNEFFNLLKEHKINNVIEFMNLHNINRKQKHN